MKPYGSKAMFCLNSALTRYLNALTLRLSSISIQFKRCALSFKLLNYVQTVVMFIQTTPSLYLQLQFIDFYAFFCFLNSVFIAYVGRKHGREASNEARDKRGPILVEREIILEDFRDFVWEGKSLESIINDRGWGLICEQKWVAYPHMVG